VQNACLLITGAYLSGTSFQDLFMIQSFPETKRRCRLSGTAFFVIQREEIQSFFSSAFFPFFFLPVRYDSLGLKPKDALLCTLSSTPPPIFSQPASPASLSR